MEKKVEVPEKLKIDDPVFHLLGIYQKKIKSLPQKYIHAFHHVHCSINYNSQQKETIKVNDHQRITG